jgi:hypothetical protein
MLQLGFCYIIDGSLDNRLTSAIAQEKKTKDVPPVSRLALKLKRSILRERESPLKLCYETEKTLQNPIVNAR